jgi:hypothetical protein
VVGSLFSLLCHKSRPFSSCVLAIRKLANEIAVTRARKPVSGLPSKRTRFIDQAGASSL